MKSNWSIIVPNFDMFRENEIHLVKKIITSSTCICISVIQLLHVKININ